MHEHMNTSLLDLFYALRGGGFGFGVIVSLTVRTHPLPDRLCVMDGSVVSYRKVSCYSFYFPGFKLLPTLAILSSWDYGLLIPLNPCSPEGTRELVKEFLDFYKTSLVGPDWGEQVQFYPEGEGYRLSFSMMTQDMTRQKRVSGTL